jgi:hypothetical protein
MLTIENTQVCGWEAAIRGMRNSHNSWGKSDSSCGQATRPTNIQVDEDFFIGTNDALLIRNLVTAGPEHAKFMRMLVVYFDITAPLYWWKEFDTYKVGTVCNSCSTMHTLHKKPLTISDFSHEHVYSNYVTFKKYIDMLEDLRIKYVVEKHSTDWEELIQLLPSSYNQRRTIMANYEVIANILRQREGHKLSEWREFITWANGLPYSNELFLA